MDLISFYLFGSPALLQGKVSITLDTRKATALLAYLVVNQRPFRRDVLAGLLWPEYSQVNARAALRRTLSTLNKALEGRVLDIQREEIGILRDVPLWTDVVEFRHCLAAAPGADRIARLTQAVKLYRGDFMEGFALRDSLEFDDWQYRTAEVLRQEFAAALDALTDDYVMRGQFADGLSWMQERLKLDPLHEQAHQQLMRLYAWVGNRNEALRQYHECRRLLQEELGVEPLEETQAIFQLIMTNSLPAPHVEPDSAKMPTAQRKRAEADVPERTLIGRQEELSILLQAYWSSKRSGGWVGVHGEAGIGKTRLVDAFLSTVRENDVRMVSVRCYSGEEGLAYSPIIEALRVGLSLPDVQACLRGLEEPWRAEAARLLPEINILFNTAPNSPSLDGPGAQNRFFEGLRQTFKVLLCNQNGGILFFDDLQWADAATLDWLAYLSRRLQDFPVLILAVWRDNGLAAGSLRQLGGSLVRTGSGRMVDLRPLTLVEVGELTRSEGISPSDVPESFIDRLFSETEGNPFFVVEYLHALQVSGDGVKWVIPASVRDLLSSRLLGLDETSLQLLGAAAVIGRSFDYEILSQVSGRSEEETVTGLEKLIQQGLLVEKSTPSIEGGEYDFHHQKIRSFVYDNLNIARRRLLHRRVAEALLVRPFYRRSPGQFASRIAFHYAQAGLELQASEFSFMAGQHALEVYANADAYEHFQNAQRMGYPQVWIVREALGDLATLAGAYGEAMDHYQSAVGDASDEDLARLHYKMGEVGERTGDWTAAEQYYRQGLAELGDGRLSTLEASRLYAAWSRACHHHGDTTCASELAEKALELAENHTHALIQAHNVAGMLARSDGKYNLARTHLETSRRLAEQSGSLLSQAAALNNLALLMVDQDEMELALDLAHAALLICQKTGDRHREAALLNTLADISHHAGQIDQAMNYLKQAVAIFADIGQSAPTLQPEIWKLTDW
jgi:predicted ATPase/DNA-binding SARP family transcriptional activator